MKVSLIDYTGAGKYDPYYAARLLIYTKNTRLTQGEDTQKAVNDMGDGDIIDQLDAISKTIRSSWEFVDFTFGIEGVTRAFTHQLVRTRTASYAQQAMRVVDMGDFGALIPGSVNSSSFNHALWDEAVWHIKRAYNELVRNGVPAQDARGLLPTNILTNIIMKVNLRTFADLVGKRDNLRAQGEYTDVIKAMVEQALGAMPWIKPFLYPERTATPNLDTILRQALGGSSPVDKPEVNSALKELDALKGTWG
jgi:flavin-dependent thymidylate synthase